MEEGRKDWKALCHRVGYLPKVPCEPALAPRIMKVGTGMRGKASLWRALKAVVRGSGLFLRAMRVMEGFKDARFHLRFGFVGLGGRETGDRRTGGRLSQLSGDRDGDAVSAGTVEMSAAVPGWEEGEVPRAET